MSFILDWFIVISVSASIGFLLGALWGSRP